MNSMLSAVLIAILAAFGFGCAVEPADAVGSVDDPTESHAEALGDCTATDFFWTRDVKGSIFDFDTFSMFSENLIEPAALTVYMPDNRAGDKLFIGAEGLPYAEQPEGDKTCTLQLHASDNGGAYVSTSQGRVTFPLDIPRQAAVHMFGTHTVTATGPGAVRILGRVSYPDRFAGLADRAEIKVTRVRCSMYRL